MRVGLKRAGTLQRCGWTDTRTAQVWMSNSRAVLMMNLQVLLKLRVWVHRVELYVRVQADDCHMRCAGGTWRVEKEEAEKVHASRDGCVHLSKDTWIRTGGCAWEVQSRRSHAHAQH